MQKNKKSFSGHKPVQRRYTEVPVEELDGADNDDILSMPVEPEMPEPNGMKDADLLFLQANPTAENEAEPTVDDLVRQAASTFTQALQRQNKYVF